MAKRVTVGLDGANTETIPDGQSVMPNNLQAVVDVDEASTGEGEPVAVQNATDELLADLLGDNAAEHVEPVEVVAGDKVVQFGIKHLSQREVSQILRKRMRLQNGKMSPAVDSDLILKINSLAQCVRKKNEAGEWVPAWTLEQIEGTPKTKGLIDNPSPIAKELTNGLLDEIWLVHRELNPLFLDAKEIVIQEQARLSVSA